MTAKLIGHSAAITMTCPDPIPLSWFEPDEEDVLYETGLKSDISVTGGENPAPMQPY